MSIRLHSSFAVHPGTWLRAWLVEPHGLMVTAAAAKLGITRQGTSDLLGGRAGLSREAAIRLENAFGVRADTLTRMQTTHIIIQSVQAHKP